MPADVPCSLGEVTALPSTSCAWQRRCPSASAFTAPAWGELTISQQSVIDSEHGIRVKDGSYWKGGHLCLTKQRDSRTPHIHLSITYGRQISLDATLSISEQAG